MGVKTSITTALAACALLLGVSTTHAAEFDTTMETILAEYVKIQEALAADSTEGVQSATHAIRDSATKLDPGQAAGEHTEHYKNIPQDLLAACEKLDATQDIGLVREAFKELSKPVSMWVTMAEPEQMSVMYCSMAKAGWVQRGSKVANPYFGSEMLSCGEKVNGRDH
jgi:Cu(I)/Ag(I) efflux system membrane fusion protein